MLQQGLLAPEKSTPAKARERILELEKLNGPRREWVWAKLGQTPLANALGHLAELAERAATNLRARRQWWWCWMPVAT
jgi:hypothetical protein